MCELLGMSFNKQVSPRFSYKALRQRGEDNPHGWGIGFYPDKDSKAAQVLKEADEAGQSRLAEFVENYDRIKSKIFIGHIRYASKGNTAYKNAHPFQRELWGKDFIFAHNGTLNNTDEIDSKRFKPIGETDSENALCRILTDMRDRKTTKLETAEDFEWLKGRLRDINKYGKFNCLFSDGDKLIAYHDISGYNGLYYLYRKPPYHPVVLADNDMEVDLRLEKGADETGYIIASHPLTNEGWVAFEPGEMIVFKEGKVIFEQN